MSIMSRNIKTEEEFDELKKTDKLLLVKFGASWCGPCKQVKPFLEKLAESENNLIVVDIDVEEACDWVSDVDSLPTFRFIKNGEQVDEYSGSKIEKIQEIVKKHI